MMRQIFKSRWRLNQKTPDEVRMMRYRRTAITVRKLVRTISLEDVHDMIRDAAKEPFATTDAPSAREYAIAGQVAET